MVAGDVGFVRSQPRHSNEDTHVVFCDDGFSDAGSTPAASTTFLVFAQCFERLVFTFPPPPILLLRTGMRLFGTVRQRQQTRRVVGCSVSLTVYEIASGEVDCAAAGGSHSATKALPVGGSAYSGPPRCDRSARLFGAGISQLPIPLARKHRQQDPRAFAGLAPRRCDSGRTVDSPTATHISTLARPVATA